MNNDTPTPTPVSSRLAAAAEAAQERLVRQAKPRKPRNWIAPTVAAVLALCVGIGIGAMAAPEPEPTPPPAPAQPAPSAPEIVTETPTECLTAFGLGEDLVKMHLNYVGHVAEALEAASNNSIQGFKTASEAMAETNAEFLHTADQHQQLRAACEGK